MDKITVRSAYVPKVVHEFAKECSHEALRFAQDWANELEHPVTVTWPRRLMRIKMIYPQRRERLKRLWRKRN